MRVNVYHEELTDEVQIVHVEPSPGRMYVGVRFILHSSNRLHDTDSDDDRSAVTFWVGSGARGRTLLREALDALDRDEAQNEALYNEFAHAATSG